MTKIKSIISSHISRVLCLIFLFTLSIIHCAAQYPEYAVGVKGGTTWSFAWFNPQIAQPTLPLTYHAGAQFRMVSEKYFGIKLELNYNQRGFETNNAHRQLNYIELPFLTHITFGQKHFRFFIDLGPQIAYLIQDQQPSTTNHTPLNTPIKNRFDYGLAAGLGFELNTKTGIYTIDTRYHFGLNNILGNSATEYYTTSTNQNITLSLAYLFPL